MQHLASHIEGAELPPEVESALSLPVDSLSVTFPVCSPGERPDICSPPPPPPLLPGWQWCSA